ncbi:MAG TPA: hypothetical protein VMM82_01590 [Spirochaetia bacterium]|nr:hypothetical protein [Spirochaetia bacterium]
MSDMLDKLLQTERSAAELVSSAEAEANRRKSEARAEAQKRHAALLKEKAVEAERAVQQAKEHAAAERKEKNEQYRAKLAVHATDREGFERLVSELTDR